MIRDPKVKEAPSVLPALQGRKVIRDRGATQARKVSRARRAIRVHQVRSDRAGLWALPDYGS